MNTSIVMMYTQAWVVGATSCYNKVQGKDRRSLRASRMVGMWKRCTWSRWEHVAVHKVSGAARATLSGLGEQMKFPDAVAKSR